MPHHRIGASRRLLAVLLAAQTGCYHFHTITSREPQDRVEAVAQRQDGTHVALAAEPLDGGVVVLASEASMCRGVERGTRTILVRKTTYKGEFTPLRGGGGGLLGLAVLLVVAPIALVVFIVQTAMPDRSESLTPAGDPPYPYLEWRGARAACGDAARPVPDLPLWLEARRSPSSCLAWSARAGPDGRLVLAASLTPTAATAGPCRDWPELATLIVTVDAEPVEGTPAPQLLPVDHRTFESLAVPLTPAQVEALGLQAMPWPTGPTPPTWSPRHVDVARLPSAVTDCTAQLDPACRATLEGCTQEAGEKADPESARLTCAYLAIRCEPTSERLEACLQARLGPARGAAIPPPPATLLGPPTP